MKKTICLLLIALLLLGSLAGCGEKAPATSSNNSVTEKDVAKTDMEVGNANVEVGIKIDKDATDVKYKDSLKIIVDNTQMSVLDPAHSLAGGQGTVMNAACIYDTLVANDNGTMVPDLALSWDIVDNKDFTFKLREDVKFHNGEPFTADDVLFTYEHAMAQMSGTAFTRFSYVDTVEVVDEHTVTFHLKNPNSDFLLYLYSPNLSILNREACESNPETGAYIGTGAWIVDEFVADEYSKLHVNENYWGEVPVTKNLTFMKVNEEATRYMMLMNDEVDVAFGCSPADFDSIRDDPNFELYTYVIVNMFYVGFNLTDPMMQDLNFRKCVSCLIDRDAIIWGTRYGYAKASPSGAFWGYSTLYRNMDLPLQGYDVEKAKEYLAASSYNGEEIEITTWNVGAEMAQMLQSELMQIGVNAKINQTDNAGFGARTKYGANEGQIIINGGNWNNYPSAAAPFYAEGSSTNKTSVCNPEITKLFDTAISTTDEAEKEACYKEIQRISYEECMYIPTTSIQHGVGAAKDVGGIILTEENAHDLSHLFRVIE